MKKLLTCLALSTIILSGCSLGLKNEGIIKVNDTIISRAKFDTALDDNLDKSFLKAFGGSKNFLKSDENPMYKMIKDSVVQQLIIQSLIEDEISKRGIKATDEDVKSELKNIIDKVGSKDELNRILKQRGISNNQFMDELKSQIKIKKLVNSIEKINISDKDAEKYYNANKAQFTHDEQVRASHILVAADTLKIINTIKSKNPEISPEELNKRVETEMAAKEALAKQILEEVIANPDSFEKIAQRKSDDKGSGERGGELGYFSKQAMVPEFANVAFSTKPNTIYDKPVKSPYGYHIIKVTDRVEAGTAPFEKVKENIKFHLETQKQVDVIRKMTDGLMKNTKIEYLDTSFDPKNQPKNKVKPQKEEKK